VIRLLAETAAQNANRSLTGYAADARSRAENEERACSAQEAFDLQSGL
jgi:hypothetical protein